MTYAPLVPESAVLWRDCDECDGTGTYHVEVTAPPPEDSGDYPCEAPGCVNGRVRVGVVWIEPDERDRIHGEIEEALLNAADPMGATGWGVEPSEAARIVMGLLGADSASAG